MTDSVCTGIHTRVNGKYRISSVYRAWDTFEGLIHGWETILWHKGEDGKDHIVEITAPNGDAQNVVDQHKKMFEAIHLNNGEWKEGEK
jgi:hypothetical protein